MKNSILFVGLLFSLFGSLIAHSQEEEKKHVYLLEGKEVTSEEFNRKTDEKVEKLLKKKALYESNQKTNLVEEIKRWNKKVEDGVVTEEMAESNKKLQAEETAKRIDAHNNLIDAEIAFLRANNVSNDFTLSFSSADNTQRQLKKEIFTTSEFTFSIGYNFMNGESLGIDDFSYGDKNNYFSMGYYWKTRLDKNNNFRVSYGFDYQSQGTELNGGRVFSVNTENTQIVALGRSVDKAKFRQDQLVFPVHFEVGGSKRKDYEDGRVRFEDKGFQMGIGGFAGFNLSSRLKLKFEEDGGDIKQKFVNAFDTEPFVYGLDAYAGWPGIKFFGRMNLNDVFKAGSVDAQYVTFGIRIK